MHVYKIVHTGANTLLGGVQEGSGMRLYHVVVACATVQVPMLPAKMCPTAQDAATLGTTDTAAIGGGCRRLLWTLSDVVGVVFAVTKDTGAKARVVDGVSKQSIATRIRKQEGNIVGQTAMSLFEAPQTKQQDYYVVLRCCMSIRDLCR